MAEGWTHSRVLQPPHLGSRGLTTLELYVWVGPDRAFHSAPELYRPWVGICSRKYSSYLGARCEIWDMLAINAMYSIKSALDEADSKPTPNR